MCLMSWWLFFIINSDFFTQNESLQAICLWYIPSMCAWFVVHCFVVILPGVTTLPYNFIVQVPQSPDSKVHGANMGPIWGRHDPGGSHIGPMNIATWEVTLTDMDDLYQTTAVHKSSRVSIHVIIYSATFYSRQGSPRLRLLYNIITVPCHVLILIQFAGGKWTWAFFALNVIIYIYVYIYIWWTLFFL